MSSVLFLLALLIIAFALTNRFHYDFLEALLILVNSLILGAYFLGYFGMLFGLKYLIIGLVILSLIELVFHARLSFKIIKTILKNPSIYIFGFLSIMVFYINNNRYFLRWDEFTHWGLAAKNIKVFNSFNWNVGTILGKGYPPAGAILQYLFGIFSPVFVEENAFIGFGIYSVIVLTHLFNKSIQRNVLYVIPLLVCILYFPLNLFSDFFSTAYIDGILGMSFLSAMIATVELHPFTWKSFVHFLLALSVLILMKTTGYQFALVLVASTLLLTVIIPTIQSRKIKSLFHPVWLSLLYTWLLNQSWYAYTYQQPLNQVGIGGLSISQYNSKWLSLITQNFPKAYQLDVYRNYINTVFMTPKSFLMGFSIGTFPLFLLSISGVLLFRIKQKRAEQKNLLNFQILFTVGFYAYLAFLLQFYLYSFSEWEASFLDSIDRYINAYHSALILFSAFVFFSFLKEFTMKFQTIMMVSLTLLSLLLFPNLESNIQINRYNALYSKDIHKIYEPLIEFSQQLKPTDKVFFIAQNTNGFDYFAARYYFTPNEMSTGWSYGPLYYAGDSSINLTVSEFEQALMGFDYVFVLNTDERFYDYYHFVFSDPSQLKDNTAFKINTYDNSQHVSLDLVFE